MRVTSWKLKGLTKSLIKIFVIVHFYTKIIQLLSKKILNTH